ncbi:MAG: hypothetical protein JXB10_02425 [Pirellulales bacterium]|nr:hypothetical protein [Pirellulales bacterium]
MQSLFPLCSAACLLLAAGCGGGLKPVPVTGDVTLDGKPVDDAGVLFCPKEKGPVAIGVTDAAGKFQLSSNDHSGALPGQYRVAITKQQILGEENYGRLGPKAVHVKWLIPEKYSRIKTSGLQATVKQEENEFHFSLSSQ